METVTDFIFLSSKITAVGDHGHKTKTLAPWKKSYDKPRQHIKKQRHHFADKDWYIQSYGFSNSHVWKWELAIKKASKLKNGCFWIVVLEKTPESPLECKEIKPVLKEISPEYSLEGLMQKLKLQHFGHRMQRVDSLEKTLTLKNWGQEEKGVTEDETLGWHHQLKAHEFTQTLGDSERQRSLACCSTWGHKQLDTI